VGGDLLDKASSFTISIVLVEEGSVGVRDRTGSDSYDKDSGRLLMVCLEGNSETG
jgi:hypothetical protein